MIVEQIKTAERNPEVSGFYNTDKGRLYYFLDEEAWSSIDDPISEEFPTLWYDPVINIDENKGMRIGVIGAENPIDDIKRVIEFMHLGQVIIVRNTQEFAENTIPVNSMFPEVEPLLIKPLPTFEERHSFKEKRTNHERQPSRFGRRNR